MITILSKRVRKGRINKNKLWVSAIRHSQIKNIPTTTIYTLALCTYINDYDCYSLHTIYVITCYSYLKGFWNFTVNSQYPYLLLSSTLFIIFDTNPATMSLGPAINPFQIQ